MVKFLEKQENKMLEVLRLLKRDLVILFGAGLCGKEYLDLFIKNGIQVKCFCDDDSKKQGSGFLGYKVISIEQLSSEKGQIIVASYGPEKLYNRLKTTQPDILNRVLIVDFYLYEDGMDYYAYYQQHADEINDVMNWLEDEKSKTVFRNLLQYKISRDKALIDEVREAPESQYFDSSIVKFADDEIFLDLGAYIGDTVESFVKHVNGKYGKVIALEPDKGNFSKLRKNTEQYHDIELFECGVAAEDGAVSFASDSTWTSTVSEDGNVTIEVRSVDSLLEGKKITFLKADIEGLETDMLKGAEQTIRKYHPQIAIAVYHRKEDIYRLAHMIHSYYPGYKFYMRHYTEMPIDTVLYAVTR